MSSSPDFGPWKPRVLYYLHLHHLVTLSKQKRPLLECSDGLASLPLCCICPPYLHGLTFFPLISHHPPRLDSTSTGSRFLLRFVLQDLGRSSSDGFG
ncbi:hypothetical protein OPV22_023817 [Ensete ventricosum]|uniref:Uncharacterized protein n=1 Tax=Ensete ventricosum TaxID=4639 RepID=A0AAV8QPF4_ENSVE|nr:hypothetical protein OPV22_023817 [Ensete ventricosum]